MGFHDFQSVTCPECKTEFDEEITDCCDCCRYGCQEPNYSEQYANELEVFKKSVEVLYRLLGEAFQAKVEGRGERYEAFMAKVFENVLGRRE